MNRESERKLLAELIKATPHGTKTLGDVLSSLYIENVMVKHLIENNIVVLPCGIGDTLHDASEYIYGIPCPEIYEVENDRMTIEKVENGDYLFIYEDAYISHEEMGKTIFESREEAERALKEGAE